MTGIIYQHLNIINGKCYVGQTSKSMDARWNKHLKDAKRGSNCSFHCAIRKYGEDAFEHKVLCEVYRETYKQLKEVLDYYENYYIEYYNSYTNGYNMTTGGEGLLGFKASKETKQKQSEQRKRELNPFYGKHHSDEAKKIISEAAKLRYQGKDNPFYGKRHSEQTKQKMSNIKRGKTLTDETRLKISEALKSKPFSESHRNNLSIANKSRAKLVLCIETGIVYNSLKDAAYQNNIDISDLSKACRSNGKIVRQKKHWMYIE